MLGAQCQCRALHAGLHSASPSNDELGAVAADSLTDHVRMMLDFKQAEASSSSSNSSSSESADLPNQPDPDAEQSTTQVLASDMSGVFEQRLTDICGSIADVETRCSLSEARADAAELQALEYEDRCSLL